MTPPVERVQAVIREGYEAGQALTPAMPNPYAVEPLKPWELARMTEAEQAQRDRDKRDQRILASAWLSAWRKGLDAYAARRAPQAESQPG